MAPTVPLCEQQYNVFRCALPAYQVRFLSGHDKVEKWSDVKIWNDALHNIRIVVSTPAVLRDALDHGFVRLTQLALLIFDEGR